MFNPAMLGSADKPLRPSALAWLIKCPVKVVLMLDELDEGGPAAQTGSMVHAGVEAFHAEPDATKRVAAAVAAMHGAAGKFPLADPTEARLYLEPYLLDPRNENAAVVALEHKVALVLPPHDLDPTGLPIHIRGTLDQIRDENGRLLVCDLKTGQTTGWQMIHDYAYQQAAYVLAARASGFPAAEPGYLIRAYGYRARGAKLPSPDGVQWWLPLDVAACVALMDRVRLQIALIRRGEIDYGPGTHCTFCPLKGLDSCVPKANTKLFALPMA
ncbi:PD-(D/E)XK nuclease superfamily protein [Gemmata sp. SH-PL17]|uniref:RecB family exonuclease n=1 Tax=Gemmata sp. SH-PL17 TaxID=1630693 RepID=UPI00078D3B6D|nr:PD-(D/E)XK nuclease family protein [Gemmata sp. SH-PL17]AMV28825.1 PD-(D/E)XK nuclease superfamily protein [Gemmata sp. SH-PL17]